MVSLLDQKIEINFLVAKEGRCTFSLLNISTIWERRTLRLVRRKECQRVLRHRFSCERLTTISRVYAFS